MTLINARYARVLSNKPSQSRVVELCARSGIVLALLLLLGEAGKKVPKSYPEAIEIAAEKKVLLLFSDSHSTARESLNWMPRKRPLLNMLK